MIDGKVIWSKIKPDFNGKTIKVIISKAIGLAVSIVIQERVFSDFLHFDSLSCILSQHFVNQIAKIFILDLFLIVIYLSQKNYYVGRFLKCGLPFPMIKRRKASVHFVNYTTQRPNINGFIKALLKKNLRSRIVQGSNMLLRVLKSGTAKVSDFIDFLNNTNRTLEMKMFRGLRSLWIISFLWIYFNAFTIWSKNE